MWGEREISCFDLAARLPRYRSLFLTRNFVGAPAYIGEMAPSAIRGLLVSLKEAFIVLGMVRPRAHPCLVFLAPGCARVCLPL